MESRKISIGIQALMALILAAASLGASAIPITGDLQLIGSAQLTDGTNQTNDVTQATTIDFLGDMAFFFAGTGDFSTISDPLGSITDFAFAPAFSGPVIDFWTIGGFSFDLNSLDSLVLTTAGNDITFINMVGSGVISAAGFDDTAGFWTLSGDTSSVQFAWNGTTGVSVPEPTVLMLLGIGLLGIGLIRTLRTA